MASWKPSACLGIIIFSIILTVSCEQTKDKMYQPVNGTYCFKRLTASAEHGCTSSRSGNTGVLHFIEQKNDTTWLIEKAEAGPYVVVLSFDFFEWDTLLKLKNSSKISGIVLTSNVTAQSFSPDDTCPNRNTGLDSEECGADEKWNPDGNSLLFVQWGFPIIYVDSPDTVNLLHKCYITHNAHDLDQQSTRSLCSIEIASHMLAAVDSQTCIRRSMMMNNLAQVTFCDPLGDFSIYLPLLPRIVEKKEDDRSVILVVTKLDGASMFEGLVPGALSPVTGIVTLLTTAHYLSNMTASVNKDTDKNIVFVLFNGESFDYIGSSRMVYDMQANAFPYQKAKEGSDEPVLSPPLLLKHVGLIVEIDQISGNEFYYHMSNGPNSKVESFIQGLSAEWSKESKLRLLKSTGKLPPSSLQRFIREDPEIEGLVIGNYDRSYVNKFYHSMLDTASQLGYKYLNGSGQWNNTIQSTIAQSSLFLAKSLFRSIYNTSSSSVAPNYDLVDELLHCYLDSKACDMFYKVTMQPRYLDKPFPLYVGVHEHNNTVTALTGKTLAWLTGKKVDKNFTSCVDEENNLVYHYLWMRGDSENETGMCIETQVNYSLALSPAFEIKGYDWASNNYSSWTESIWQQMTARIFLKPSKQHEALTISLGLFVLILSFVIVYFIKTKASVLFNHQVLGSGGC